MSTNILTLYPLILTGLVHGREASDEVEMGDVYNEVDEVMTKLRVGMHKIKPTSRKYAFELPDIPRKADYLKLMYPYDSEFVTPGKHSLVLIHTSRACLAYGTERRNLLTCLRYNDSAF